MRSRVNQLQTGTIEYYKPEVVLNKQDLKGMIMPGKVLSFDVGIVSENGIPMHLFFYSDQPSVTVPEQLTIGRSGKFTVEISAKYRRPGEVISGRIDILYNGGETYLNYEFTVCITKNSEKAYSFNSLSEFVDFYHNHPKEAVNVFLWDEFTEFSFMQDMRLRALYKSFAGERQKENGLKEFLFAADALTEDYKDESKEEASSDDRNTESPNDSLHRDYLFADCILKVQRYVHTDFQDEIPEDPGFEKLAEEFPDDVVIELGYAWYCIVTDDMKKARELLVKVQDPVLKERSEKKDIYCLFLYLVALVQKNDERRENALSLTRKYFEEGTLTRLMHYLAYHILPEYLSNPSRKATFLSTCDLRGISDVYLYQDMCFLFEEDVRTIDILTESVLYSMLYGLKNGLLSERNLFRLLSLNIKNQGLIDLYVLVLKTGYRVYRHQDLLRAAVDILMQQKKTKEDARGWYEEAVLLNLEVPGLFEYYLRSQNQHPDQPLPLSLITYFADKPEAKGINYDILYVNLLRFYQNHELFSIYKNRIIRYALLKMNQGEYSLLRLPLFSYVLREEYLNDETAKGMQELLYLRKVTTERDDIRRVILHYDQISADYTAKMENKEALMPVYSDEAIFSLEDEKGQRHYDPDIRTEILFDEPEIKKLCLLYRSDSYLARLTDADRIIKERKASNEELILLMNLLNEHSVDDFYKARINETITDMALDPEYHGMDLKNLLLNADLKDFTVEYRPKLLKALIQKGCYLKAYGRICNYGFYGLESEAVKELLDNILPSGNMKNEPWLKTMCYHVFQERLADKYEYEYLSRFYNGTAENMLYISSVIRKKRLKSYGLYERTFITAFYVQEDKSLDFLFDAYRKEESTDRSVIEAFLVLKAHNYYTKKKRLSDDVVSEMKERVMNLPRVCLLALITYLSGQKNLKDEDVRLTEALLLRAVTENISMKCFHKFEGKIHMPAELEGRVYVEIRDDNAKEVSVIGQILPTRRYFHRTLMEIYPGVFTRSFVLYKREWIEYYYVIKNKDGSIIEKEAKVIAKDNDPFVIGSRYDDITRLENMVDKGDLRDTSELMRSLILKENMIEEIFGKQ